MTPTAERGGNRLCRAGVRSAGCGGELHEPCPRRVGDATARSRIPDMKEIVWRGMERRVGGRRSSAIVSTAACAWMLLLALLLLLLVCRRRKRMQRRIFRRHYDNRFREIHQRCIRGRIVVTAVWHFLCVWIRVGENKKGFVVVVVGMRGV